ncbi:hypothetical protein [Massilia sp.]|jgi:hypothetical protein|uniref:hypothetical protein n=1 Tax=Massilia sp. TaxID=1882437 RepID=UPI0028A601C0|nr:hypothetical protein [Massilia sp.]
MAQENKDNAGFSLPDPSAPAAPAAPDAVSAPEAGTATTGFETQPAAALAAENTGSRDLLIGGAILLVLFIVFFLAKNAYANGLVAKKLPPNKANASAWWLFIFLASAATGVVLAGVNASRFMAPVIVGPIAVVALASLVLTFTASRK